ncbi:MAG: AAA family ATPase [Planctomycetes bacterium]|nr:AAA family ATPase [Planctomycetota bacterium]
MSEAELARIERELDDLRKRCDTLRSEIARVYLGNPELIEWVVIAAISGGHVLLEGVPGLGKTVLVKTLARTLEVKFSRIQFTPDLMPADITGTNILIEREGGGRKFEFQPGPIFSNLILADEINRATPKTQSALLEAMQEASVTVSGRKYTLEEPFLVAATQNPIEMEGTFPLPEAQLDRFFFKLKISPASEQQIVDILDATTGPDSQEPRPSMNGRELLRLRSLARELPVSEAVKRLVAKTVTFTDPGSPHAAPLAKKYLRCGASPRGAQAMLLAAKALALLAGRFHVERSDVERAAPHALRHRVLRNFEGEAEGVDPDRIVEEALANAKIAR